MAVLAFVLAVADATAVPSGSIIGVVFDAATRTPLAGASVVVLSTGLGAAADPEGRFFVSDIPAGTYSVEASMVGYQPQTRTMVVVCPSRTTELVFRLSQSPIQLAEVTVRADYFPRVKDAPVSERNFSAEEIEVAPGGLGDIQRVVQAMPAVVSSGDQDNEVIVRGGNPNENLFLIDGIEVPFPNHFGSFVSQGGPINMLDPILIREVDFVAGAFPAGFGTRSSSVMDISLKRGSSTGFDGSIDLGMAGAGVVLEGPLPGRGSSFIGSYHKSFLELMAKAGVWGMSAVPYYDNALGKLTFRLSRNNELSLLGIWGGDFIHIRPDEDVISNRYSVRQRTDRYAGGLSLQTLFGEQGYGRLLVSGSDARWQGFAYRDTIESDTLQTNNTSDGYFGLRYDGTLRWLHLHETQAGIGASRVRFNYDFYSVPDTIWHFRYDSLNNPVESTVVSVNRFSAQASARSNRAFGYLQHRIPLGTFGSLSLGGRLDWFEYTGHYDLAPRLGFSTRPLLLGLSVHAGYGWHFQTPDAYVLLWDSAANRNLRSRRSDHSVLGIERLFGNDVKLSLEGYHKRTTRIPIPRSWLTRDPYDFVTAYLDTGSGTSTGLELFLQKKHSGNWHGSLAYSLAESRTDNPQESTTVKTIPADYDYRHVLTVSATYRLEFHQMDWYRNLPGWFRSTLGGFLFSDQSDVGLRIRHMGGRPYTPKEWQNETRRWIDNADLRNTARYPSYQRLDLRWDHRFLLKSWSFAWYLEVQNALDRQNVWFYNYPAGEPEPETVYQMRRWIVGGMVVEF